MGRDRSLFGNKAGREADNALQLSDGFLNPLRTGRAGHTADGDDYLLTVIFFRHLITDLHYGLLNCVKRETVFVLEDICCKEGRSNPH